MSALSSMPIDKRTTSGPAPAAVRCSSVSWRCVVDADRSSRYKYRGFAGSITPCNFSSRVCRHEGSRFNRCRPRFSGLQYVQYSGTASPRSLSMKKPSSVPSPRPILCRQLATSHMVFSGGPPGDTSSAGLPTQRPSTHSSGHRSCQRTAVTKAIANSSRLGSLEFRHMGNCSPGTQFILKTADWELHSITFNRSNMSGATSKPFSPQ
jgi:hypothetical protein